MKLLKINWFGLRPHNLLSFIVFSILKYTIGLRVTEEEELKGLDISEHGTIAYPGKRERE